MQTVLITTSGVGSRLGDITNYLNKSLVRVGNKFTICYIIDKYDPKTTKFVITLGYLGHLVKEFLDIAYENNTFEYVYVNNFDKDGSSLVYSLLQAKNVLQCPFTFYCCDSIILDNVLIDNHNMKNNILCVAPSDDGASYASVTVAENYITKIHKKGEIKYDYIFTGVSYIYDYEEYWNILEQVYKNQPNNKELSDIDVIHIMLNKSKFQFIDIKQWYDIGNIKSLNIANKNIKCDFNILHKNNESLCFLNNKVIKFFSDKDSLMNRVSRGKFLEPNCPRILNSNEHFFSMEFIKGQLLSNVYQYGEIYNLLEWSKTNLWINKSINDMHKDTCMKFYKIKTLERLHKLDISEVEIINGIIILPIKELLDQIDWNELITDTFYQFHGDFILDNIIKTDNTYKLIDWRQDFGGNIDYGDMYYDLSKLRHNIIFNHDNIANGLFKLHLEEGKVTLDLKCNYFLIQQLEDFDKFIYKNDLNIKKIKILTALIWLNMAPLHEHNLSQFLFYFGKYNLALVLENYTLP
jgi:choline kinase